MVKRFINHTSKTVLSAAFILAITTLLSRILGLLRDRMLAGKFGGWLERLLKNWQMPKIRREEFILVMEDELSFHPSSKQTTILGNFFTQA